METSLSDLVVVFVCTLVVLFGLPLLLWLIHRGPSFVRDVVEYFIILPGRTANADPEITSSTDEIPGTDAVVPEPPAVPGPSTTPSAPASLTRDLTDRETVILLATQKNGAKWRYSKNAIHTLVGGNRAEILKLIGDVRGEQLAEAPPDDIILTPHAGRPTRASYYDDPTLEYKAPSV